VRGPGSFTSPRFSNSRRRRCVAHDLSRWCPWLRDGSWRGFESNSQPRRHGDHGTNHSENQLFDSDLGLTSIAEGRPASRSLTSVVSVCSVVEILILTASPSLLSSDFSLPWCRCVPWLKICIGGALDLQALQSFRQPHLDARDFQVQVHFLVQSLAVPGVLRPDESLQQVVEVALDPLPPARNNGSWETCWCGCSTRESNHKFL